MRLLGLCLLGGMLSSTAGWAHTVRQQVSAYRGNSGIDRDRLQVDMNLDYKHRATITGSSYSLSASRDQYRKEDISDDEYSKEYYGTGVRERDTFSATANQNWNKITDTNVLFSNSSDGVVTSYTGGFGISHWFWHETLRAGVDVSRTVVDQPQFEILDEDSDIITPPSTVTSNGFTVSARNLATTTTITDYSWQHTESNDRPPANSYSFGVKQFIPPTESAVHATVARAVNRGRLTTKTSYGAVDAWIIDTAFLQELWRGARTKASYRYYQEDEVTRVEQNEYVRGSDTYSLAFSQDVDKKMVDALPVPVTVEVAASRYLTNEISEGEKIAASILEVGLLARF